MTASRRIAAVLALCLAGCTETTTSLDGAVPVRHIAAVALRDDRGNGYRFADVPAHGVVVVTGYTRCPDRCPLILARVTIAVARLPPAQRPRLLFVTIDPAHDSADDLRTFAGMWRVPVVALTGSPRAIERAVLSIGATVPPPGDLESHDARAAFVNRDGEVRVNLGAAAGDQMMSAALRSIDAGP